MLRSLGEMHCCFPLRLKMWTLFVLSSAGIICWTAADPLLQCNNDYLFIINCSLNVALENTSEVNWLFIRDYSQRTWCRMTKVDNGQFCSINIHSLVSDDYQYVDPLNDSQVFEIFLCTSNVFNTCRLLIEEYSPESHIKPNAPCCLNLSRMSTHHHFTWRSTYEEYSYRMLLTKNMMYQLRYYTRGQGNNISSHEITTEYLNCSVSDKNLIPGVEYGAQVRSSPNQVSYWGQWSDWSPEIHWKTESAEHDVTSTPFLSGLGQELFFLCVLVLLLLLSFACIKMWRRRPYIPTPAPYFHTLYNDYHGDFKSWVVTGDKTTNGAKVLQIDTWAKCVEVQEEEPWTHTPQQIQQEATYSNIPHSGCDSFLPGVPYAVSTAAPAEDDQGCPMCSKHVLDTGTSLYSNEYCTLKAFHQSHSCSAASVAQLRTEYEN